MGLLKDQLLNKQKNNAIAVVEGAKSITYERLIYEALQLSEAISNVSFKRCNIAILLPNSIQYVVSYCSIVLSNNVVVPIYFKATYEEIKNIVEFCDIGIVLTNTLNLKRLLNIEYQHAVSIINVDDLTITTLGNKERNASTQCPAEVLVMLGTSGSTSAPKRVMLSDENVIENALGIIHSLKYKENERFLCILPLTFASGNTSQLIVSLLLSSTLYIYGGPMHPRFVFDAVKKYGITTTTIVPSILKVLLSSDKDYSTECETLKTICFGGGPTDSTTIQKLIDHPMRNKFVQMYGQTEASTRISHLHYSENADKPFSVGQPLFNIFVQVEPIEHNSEVGEILVKGPNVMVGYYKEQTTTIINGWLATGDIGYIASNNFIYITGRKKNIIICSGMNIHAEEVEDVIYRHPKVAEAVVYGISDQAHGEVPIADIVVKNNEDLLEDELRAFCSAYLSEFKVPVKFNFVNALQRTYNGKIARKRRS